MKKKAKRSAPIRVVQADAPTVNARVYALEQQIVEHKTSIIALTNALGSLAESNSRALAKINQQLAELRRQVSA